MSSLLDRVSSPADVKALDPQELEALAQEIRNELISVVTSNGGHLASSLGSVELTLALHRVFDSPEDKIIWDVGHQSYAHKIITGRKDAFKSIRTYGGLSGFPNISESPHDHFGTGHASTSISAALGMAKARDLSGQNYHVIAVIGDGSIGGGMALEAINSTTQLGSKIIVILNDNGMSISPSVGAIARMLDRIRFTHNYNRAVERGRRIIKSVPFSDFWWKLARRFKSALKGLLMPTRLWEEFGFTYLGPVDGHNMIELEKAFKYAQSYSRKPVLLHVISTKGKGYGPAEDDAVCFHGIPPSNGKKASAPSYSRVFADTCLEIMKNDSRVVVITAAMPEGNSLTGVQAEFPERVIDVGICEQHAVTFAAGMATQGYRPIVAIYSTFLQRAFDQIVHDICIQKLPVAFAIDRAGIVGEDGKTHQGTLDLSYLNLIPNMTIATPMDENELRHLLFTAIYNDAPMAVRYPRGCGYGVTLEDPLHKLPIGKAEIVRKGHDLAILAAGATVHPAILAADALAGEGREVAVINMRFIKPLDEALLEHITHTTTNILTVEENVLSGGLGSSVSQALHNNGFSGINLKNIGVNDEFTEHGPQDVLRKNYYLDSQGILFHARQLLENPIDCCSCIDCSDRNSTSDIRRL
ncbi:MAG: 1-deoxy-D-xylulose-5-phosphate synthase [Dehalococcoidales bacterium]|jgi:1-deoxy-D-xylulose-5-phosphate synthase|nr:1-deoxy-D-xylulose-5-phosphate synthase [Dehalococcoidales bacterium]MDX9985924.1 1-deoxy-D-xylulose-5-phosphate synthase [Dehalococcoidales bacterium]